MKILITGGKSATALKLLKAFKQDQIILSDYDEVPSFSSAAYRLISLGAKNEDTIAHTMLNYCLNEGVDAVLPIQSFEVEPIAKAELLFSEFDIKVLLPNAENLSEYLNPFKADHWAVFVAGDLIFTTIENEVLASIGREKHLNGAYYFENGSVLTLSLITI